MTEHQGKNLKLFLRATDKTMDEIAAELEISRTWLYDYFKRSELEPEFIAKLNDKGYDFKVSTVSEAKQVEFPDKENIIYVPLAAYGGFMQGYANKVFFESLKRFSLPNIHGEHFAFQVQGDSMTPFAGPGDVVISHKEERHDWMLKGRMYVLQTVDGIIVKFFEKILDNKAYFKSASKTGENPIIPLKNIKGVYQVVKVVKDLM